MQGVKLENTANEICHGCLSNDRRVSGLCEYLETYKVVIASRKNLIYGIDNIRVCWECKAMLKKFKLFQQRLHAAQDALTLMFYQVEYHPTKLSKLSTINKYYYDHDYQHIEATIDNKEDVDMVVEPATELGFCIKEELILDDEYIDDVPETKDEVELNDVADNVELPPEYDMKPARAKRRKLVQSRHNSVSYYKQYTTLIKGEKTDWGNLGDHFTMITFGEAEMEEHFLSKERKFSEYTRFKFKCDLCQLGYMRIDDLKRHDDLNHQDPNKPMKCSLCNQILSSQPLLELHWQSHTLIAKCKMCKDYCRPRGMKNHLNNTHTHKYACRFCNLTFGKILHFSVHYKKMHQNYTCDYCNKSCKTKKLVEKHIWANHTQYTCKDCFRVFPNYKLYKRHSYEIHPKNYTGGSESSYCVECDKQYATVNKYKQHLQTSPKHTDIKRVILPCPACGKTFRKKSYLNNHYNLYHAKKSKHYCELCDKYFCNGYGLRKHTTYVHMKATKVKDKMCDLCGRGFATNRILLNHRRTHTGERPFHCPFCAASFTQKQAMQSHCKTQHKDMK